MRKFLILVSVFFLGTLFVGAQVPPEGFIPPVLFSPAAEIKGTVNCFDYYHFGSVQADIEGMGGGTVSGVPMHFRGNIKNDNTYPIVEGALYAKVFRKQTDDSLIHQNGHNLVDQFFVKENISIPTKGKIPVEFDWKVPSYAISGDYQIAFFFTSAKKFNLLGLSFTDDVVGNIDSFKISGEQKAGVSFNKNTVKIQNNEYRFAAFPPRNDKDKDIPVTAELVNGTNESQIVRVTWKLYGWDAQTEENLLNTKEEDVILNAKETKTLSYTDTNRTHTVHLLVAEAKYQDTKSILDIRYVRDGVDKVRLNFPSITAYPLEQDTENTVFSCVHNSGTATVQNNKLILDLKDENNNLIHSYTYNGAVSGAMMAVKDTFKPSKTYKNFSLEAKLYQDDKLVDQVTMKYECDKIGTDCPKPMSTTMKMVIGTGVLLFVVLSILIIRKKKIQTS
ncbi:MAG: hypothetical protein NTZ13_01620 [Candidatus Parcubacteria bacterium]|nr:hypothetical protein [Candidatus Parcubacteria bacterium]